MIKTKGFSLIELMLVLLMIAFVTAGVSIIIGNTSANEKRLYETGNKLFTLMGLALDEALLQQRTIALTIVSDATQLSTYRWYYHKHESWHLLTEPLSPLAIPEDIMVTLSVADQQLSTLLENAFHDPDGEELLAAPVLFSPNSEVSEFALELAFKDSAEPATYRIYLDQYGQLSNSLIDNDQSNNN